MLLRITDHMNAAVVGRVVVGLIASLALLTACSGSSGPPVMLRLNLPPGQTFTLQSAVHSISDASGDGKTQHSDSTVTTTSTVTVEAVDADGTAHVSVTFVAVKLDVNSGNPISTVWDTAQPPSPAEAGVPMVQGWRALVGKSYTATILPNGTVTGSTVDDLLTSVMGQLGLSSDLTASNLEVLKSQFGNGSNDGSLQQSLPLLPAKSIRAGDSWKTDHTATRPPFRTRATFTLKERSATEASVTGRAQLSTNPKQSLDTPPTFGSGSASYDMKGDQATDLKIDLATGLVTSGQVTQKTSGTISFLQNGQSNTGIYSTTTDITFSWRQ